MASALGLHFENLDQEDTFDGMEKHLEHAETKNLTVVFSKAHADAAINVSASQLHELLDFNTKQDPAPVTWFHVFGPDEQGDLIDEIADRYGMSSRLKALMKSHNASLSAKQADQPVRAGNTPAVAFRDSRFSDNKDRPFPKTEADLEKAHLNPGQEKVILDNFNHYNIVSRVWHFWSIDWTKRCLCVGYNSLSNLIVQEPRDTTNQDQSRRERLRMKFASEHSSRPEPEPNAIRLWNWLLICDDNTIISIQESAKSATNQAKNKGRSEKNVVKNSRKTLVNVLRHLSKAGIQKADAINALTIRPDCSRDSASAVDLSDSPGLLFYYLFDDWYTAFDLVANDDCRYTTVLNQLRKDMLCKAQVSKIDQLHQAGQQLHVLKRMYESYNLIIDRILTHINASNGLAITADNDLSIGWKPAPPRTEHLTPNLRFSEDGARSYQVPLSPKVSARFERLRDRITMFALSEIEQCMEERESLVSFNFNLIAFSQAQAVEKLTRITILLAKVTILFMPVSVLTGYFSTQIDDLQHIYTAKTYWISFAVTVLVSMLFLVLFGYISHTIEGGVVYRNTAQATIQSLRKLFGRDDRETKTAKGG